MAGKLKIPPHVPPNLGPWPTHPQRDSSDPDSVRLGPTRQVCGHHVGHCLQGTAGTGKQVRSLTPPKDASLCSPCEQERLRPTQRAAQTRKCSGGCRPTTHRPHGGMLGPLPDALGQTAPAGGQQERVTHWTTGRGPEARPGPQPNARPGQGAGRCPARHIWVQAGDPRPQEHTRV